MIIIITYDITEKAGLEDTHCTKGTHSFRNTIDTYNVMLLWRRRTAREETAALADIVLIYASMTGNTEEMADAIAAGIRSEGGEVVVKSVMDANASELERYDAVLLGAYTWGDGELPDEFLDFYEEMDDIRLTGRKAAVFGSCDSCYPEYGAAVDLLINKLRETGADVVLPGLKVELSPSTEEAETCRRFGSEFVKLAASGAARS